MEKSKLFFNFWKVKTAPTKPVSATDTNYRSKSSPRPAGDWQSIEEQNKPWSLGRRSKSHSSLFKSIKNKTKGKKESQDANESRAESNASCDKLQDFPGGAHTSVSEKGVSGSNGAVPGVPEASRRTEKTRVPETGTEGQSQKAVTAHWRSKQIQPSVFAENNIKLRAPEKTHQIHVPSGSVSISSADWIGRPYRHSIAILPGEEATLQQQRPNNPATTYHQQPAATARNADKSQLKDTTGVTAKSLDAIDTMEHKGSCDYKFECQNGPMVDTHSKQSNGLCSSEKYFHRLDNRGKDARGDSMIANNNMSNEVIRRKQYGQIERATTGGCSEYLLAGKPPCPGTAWVQVKGGQGEGERVNEDHYMWQAGVKNQYAGDIQRDAKDTVKTGPWPSVVTRQPANKLPTKKPCAQSESQLYCSSNNQDFMSARQIYDSIAEQQRTLDNKQSTATGSQIERGTESNVRQLYSSGDHTSFTNTGTSVKRQDTGADNKVDIVELKRSPGCKKRGRQRQSGGQLRGVCRQDKTTDPVRWSVCLPSDVIYDTPTIKPASTADGMTVSCGDIFTQNTQHQHNGRNIGDFRNDREVEGKNRSGVESRSEYTRPNGNHSHNKLVTSVTHEQKHIDAKVNKISNSQSDIKEIKHFPSNSHDSGFDQALLSGSNTQSYPSVVHHQSTVVMEPDLGESMTRQVEAGRGRPGGRQSHCTSTPSLPHPSRGQSANGCCREEPGKEDQSEWFIPMRASSCHEIPRKWRDTRHKEGRCVVMERDSGLSHTSLANSLASSHSQSDWSCHLQPLQYPRRSRPHSVGSLTSDTDLSSLMLHTGLMPLTCHVPLCQVYQHQDRHSTPKHQIPPTYQEHQQKYHKFYQGQAYVHGQHTLEKCGSADSVCLQSAGHLRGSHRRRHRSSSRGKSRTLSSIPQEVQEEDIMPDKLAVSLAASAVYIPGTGMADKLRLAASKGQPDKVKELLLAGADFDSDREGRTAIHYAALNGHQDVVKVLVADGCDIDCKDKLGYTALHRAAAQGHLEVIRVLIQEGCLLDCQDEVHGNAALHEAAWNGYSRTLELLLKNKCSVRVINKAGFSALHLAAQNGHNQSARSLLYGGCSSDYRNNYGDTALHTAGRYGHAGVTRILLSAHCKTNEQNKNGDTALHIASALKRRKIAKLLLEANISTSLKNKQSETAGDVAARKEHNEIVAMIIAHQKTNKKDKKKDKKDKKAAKNDKHVVLVLPGEKEKKEKRGLFRKKTKTKEKVEKERPRSKSHDRIHTRQEAPPASINHSAPSEASSGVTAAVPTQELLRGYTGCPQHQQVPARSSNCHKGTAPPGRGPVQGRTSQRLKSDKTVKGLLSDYTNKPGVQYYRDLAGNLKQGPVGFAPKSCQCAPAIKKLQKKMEADHGNLYDQIDASHKVLVEKVDALDRNTAQQVYAMDKLTRDRLEAERRECEARLGRCSARERQQMEVRLQQKEQFMQSQLHAWVDERLSNFEQHFPESQCGSVCMSHDIPPAPRHRDDGITQFSRGRNVDAPLPGQLYRSKSDETLSQSSGHPTQKHWRHKFKFAKDSRYSNMPKVSDRPRKASRQSDAGRDMMSKEYFDRPQRIPQGRSPEGNSTGYNDSEPYSHSGGMNSTAYNESTPYTGGVYNTWGSRRPMTDAHRQYEQAEGHVNIVPSVCESSGGRLHVSRESSPSTSHSVPNHLDTVAEVYDPVSPPANTPCTTYNSAQQLAADSSAAFSSPDPTNVHHCKTDSGSNPDSGYGRSMYGVRPFLGKPPITSTPAATLSPSDPRDTSVGTNTSSIAEHSSSSFGLNRSDTYEVMAEVHAPLPSYVERWYERRPAADSRAQRDCYKMPNTFPDPYHKNSNTCNNNNSSNELSRATQV